MTRSEISFFIDDAATTAMFARVPRAEQTRIGGFAAASNSPGIGISTANPGLAQSLPNWTLLDQRGQARNNQRGQLIGGSGISAPSQSNGAEGTLPAASIRLHSESDLPPYPNESGEMTLPAFGAELVNLAAGWARSA